MSASDRKALLGMACSSGYRQRPPANSPEDQKRLFNLGEEYGKSCADMALCSGNDEGLPEEALNLLALVEVKKGRPST